MNLPIKTILLRKIKLYVCNHYAKYCLNDNACVFPEIQLLNFLCKIIVTFTSVFLLVSLRHETNGVLLPADYFLSSVKTPLYL